MKFIKLAAIFSMLFIDVIVLNAQELNIKKGWNLLGALDNVTVTSIPCVNSIWVYNSLNDSWNLYQKLKDDSNFGYGLVSNINKGKGFWLNSSCEMTYNIATGVFSKKDTIIDSTFVQNDSLPNTYTLDDGRLLGAQCAQCHGTNGISVNSWDSIISEDNLLEEMHDDNLLMNAQAKGYTSVEILKIEVWLNSQNLNISNESDTLYDDSEKEETNYIYEIYD